MTNTWLSPVPSSPPEIMSASFNAASFVPAKIRTVSISEAFAPLAALSRLLKYMFLSLSASLNASASPRQKSAPSLLSEPILEGSDVRTMFILPLRGFCPGKLRRVFLPIMTTPPEVVLRKYFISSGILTKSSPSQPIPRSLFIFTIIFISSDGYRDVPDLFSGHIIRYGNIILGKIIKILYLRIKLKLRRRIGLS